MRATLALTLVVCGACAGSSLGTRPGGECGMPTGGSGIATYYDATGAGACSFDATPDDLMVVSMNAVDYGTSEWCGACLEVEGPTGKTITVRVVDECPECQKGNIDLSAQAFAQLSPLEVGGAAVMWHEADRVSLQGRFELDLGRDPDPQPPRVRSPDRDRARALAPLTGTTYTADIVAHSSTSSPDRHTPRFHRHLRRKCHMNRVASCC